MRQFSPHQQLPARDILCWDGAPIPYRWVTVLQRDGGMCVIEDADGNQESVQFSQLLVVSTAKERDTLTFLIEMRENKQALQDDLIQHTRYADGGERVLTQMNVIMKHQFEALLRPGRP